MLFNPRPAVFRSDSCLARLNQGHLSNECEAYIRRSSQLISLSETTAGRSHEVAFHTVASSSSTSPEPPLFTLGAFPAELSRFYYRQKDLHAAGVFFASGLTLTGPYILREGGNVISCPEANIHPGHLEQLFAGRDTGSDGGSRQVSGRCVLLAGPGYTVYGHWLVDLLPKLYLLRAAAQDIFSLRYIIPRDVPQFALTWLKLLGIKEDQLVPIAARETLTCGEILIPTTLHNGVRVSHVFYDAREFLIQALETAVGPIGGGPYGERLFISRSGAPQTRLLVNRAEIERLAEDAGFTIVHPQALPIPEQVRMFRNATVVAGEYGSGLHGTIFSRCGTRVCAIRGDALHPAFIQSGLGSALNHPTGYVFGRNVDADGTFVVDPALFADGLLATCDGATTRVRGANRGRSLWAGDVAPRSPRHPCGIEQAIHGWARKESARWLAYQYDPTELSGKLRALSETSATTFLFSIDRSDVSFLQKPKDMQDPGMIARAEHYLRFFREVIKLSEVPKKLEFACDFGDGRATDDLVPIFVFQKEIGSKNILLPDIDFLGANDFFRDYVDSIPYKDKLCRAVFAGSTTGSRGFGHTGPLISADMARRLATQRLRSWASFKESSKVVFKLPHLFEYEDEQARAALEGMGLGGEPVPWHEQFRYKFIISMDGNGATCSRVAIALKSNSVLLKYSSPYDLYYFSGLTPWVHYIPIRDDKDVEEIVDAEMREPSIFESIAREGSEFFSMYLTRERAAHYTGFLLELYASLFPDPNIEPSNQRLPADPTVWLLEGAVVHVQDIGDIWYGSNSIRPAPWLGRPRSGKWIEGFCLIPRADRHLGTIHYEAIFVGGERSHTATGGEYVGTRGEGRPLIGLRFHLPEGDRLLNGISIRATFTDGFSVAGIPAGEDCIAPTRAPLEAFCIETTPG